MSEPITKSQKAILQDIVKELKIYHNITIFTENKSGLFAAINYISNVYGIQNPDAKNSMNGPESGV